MAIAGLGDAGGRTALARSLMRRVVARAIANDGHPARRQINPNLLGLDDAGFATLGSDRRAIERAGQGAFTL